jgi:hypothetical protein
MELSRTIINCAIATTNRVRHLVGSKVLSWADALFWTDTEVSPSFVVVFHEWVYPVKKSSG